MGSFKRKKSLLDGRDFLNFGSPTWARTRDTRINSPLLYRLSYWRSISTAAFYASTIWWSSGFYKIIII
jgi:hypothetical protein